MFDLKFQRLKFVKKTNMPNSVKSLGYIKCYSFSSPKPVKWPSNFIRHNWQKICSSSRRPKTVLKNIKRPYFSGWLTILLLTTERRLKGQWYLEVDLSPTILNTETTDETNWKTRLVQTHWWVQLIYIKVQAGMYLEPPLEYNQDQISFMNQGSLRTILWLFVQSHINSRRENR